MKEMIKKINFMKVAEWAFVLAMLVVPFLSAANLAHADLAQPNCRALNGVSCQNTDLAGIIIKILDFLLGIAFLIAVLMLVLGGFRYITSAGNEETAGKGKKTIFNALIGIAIVILSYVIVQVVNKTLSSAAG